MVWFMLCRICARCTAQLEEKQSNKPCARKLNGCSSNGGSYFQSSIIYGNG
jgi:hypothetical protein